MSPRIDKFERTVRRTLRQLVRQRVENRLETVAKSPALIRGALSPEAHSASTPHVLHDVCQPRSCSVARGRRRAMHRWPSFQHRAGGR
jgi:hypothetical protein